MPRFVFCFQDFWKNHTFGVCEDGTVFVWREGYYKGLFRRTWIRPTWEQITE